MDVKVILLVISATVLWGIVPLTEMRYMDGVSVVTIAALFGIIVFIIAPFTYLANYRTLHVELPTLLTHNRHVMIYGTLGVFISLAASALYLHGIKLCGERNTNAVVAITCAYPVVTALLLWLVYGHALDIRGWCGLTLLVAGCVLIGARSR